MSKKAKKTKYCNCLKSVVANKLTLGVNNALAAFPLTVDGSGNLVLPFGVEMAPPTEVPKKDEKTGEVKMVTVSEEDRSKLSNGLVEIQVIPNFCPMCGAGLPTANKDSIKYYQSEYRKEYNSEES